MPSADKKDGLDQIDGTEEEQNASAREKQQESELKKINEIYLNESDEPESQNVANMLKLGQKH